MDHRDRFGWPEKRIQRYAVRGKESPMKLNPYLNFDGTCREAFEFYAQHLGAKIQMMMTCDQAPPGKTEPMRSAYLTLSCDSDEQAEQFYKVLSEGGQIFMALGETFYATNFAMLRDRFGVNWMLIHERPMPAQA
jgi:PhnB protein